MRPTPSGVKRESGIALIVVMLVIIVLAGLATAFAFQMKVEMRLARYSSDSTRMQWIGRSGVEKARYLLSMQSLVPGRGNYEALNQKWAHGHGDTNELLAGIGLDNQEVDGGVYNVVITDMERKFNINAADEPLLQQALTVIGVDASEFSKITDSILDWRDPDSDPRLSGAEDDYYLSLNPPYNCKNGYIDDLSELLLVKGVSPQIYWGPAVSAHFISTYPTMKNRKLQDAAEKTYPVGMVDLFNALSAGRLNVNTASATALQLVPGLDPNTAGEIVRTRAGMDGVDGTEDDTPFTSVAMVGAVPGIRPDVMAVMSRYCDVRSHTFEARVDVQLDGFKQSYYAVLRRNGNRPGDFVVVQFYWK
jgi:general secretion pathway protein K